MQNLNYQMKHTLRNGKDKFFKDSIKGTSLQKFVNLNSY